MPHPLEVLHLEAPFFAMGPDYFDPVAAASSLELKLRWRNPDLLERLGLDPARVRDQDLVDAFGHFKPLPGALHGPLAQRYIGYQFQMFNPNLGDGRGFLLAQVRSPDGSLIDLGTKGSGQTPYSRGGDGRLTLKGGVREIIAAEFLHAMGVKTSRALTVIEHTQKLYRGDEPSPTRASILVRAGEAHVRFGTFERYFYLVRDEAEKERLLTQLADHVVQTYYRELEALTGPERYLALFDAVQARCATLVASWIKAGFAHGVLNTDNMNIAGDSFDYGPFAFMEHYDPDFTAAYFDQSGLYSFESQADAVYWNLAMLTRPFGVIAPAEGLEASLSRFPVLYRDALRAAMLPRLGFVNTDSTACRALLKATMELLRSSKAHYHGFFRALTDRVEEVGIEAAGPTLPEALWRGAPRAVQDPLREWTRAWLDRLSQEPVSGRLEGVRARLRAHNPVRAPYRPEIERVWEAITERDDWAPLYAWIEALRAPFE